MCSWTIPGQMSKVLNITFFDWFSALGEDSKELSQRSTVKILVRYVALPIGYTLDQPYEKMARPCMVLQWLKVGHKDDFAPAPCASVTNVTVVLREGPSHLLNDSRASQRDIENFKDRILPYIFPHSTENIHHFLFDFEKEKKIEINTNRHVLTLKSDHPSF